MTNQRIGYIRVSSLDQNPERQLEGIALDKVFTDKASARDTNRPQLQAALNHVRAGDMLIVHSMDRLARNVEDMLRLVREMNDKGVSVEFVKENMNFTAGNDHPLSTEKRLRWYWKPSMGYSWQVDETYVKVKGKWAYLYRAIDKCGHTIDFYLSATRNTQAAKRFLGKSLKSMKPWAYPGTINTDKAPAYRSAITELKAEGKCPPDTVHRQFKYLNNIIEADHGKLKRLINPVRGFKSMKTAYATIKGFELMRMFKKGQLDIWKLGQGLTGEIWLIERQFGIYRT